MANSYGVKSIVAVNFRNYDRREFPFNLNNYIIHGDNGTGKTSLLEAISLLSYGKGLKGESLENLVQQGKKHAFLSAEVIT